MAVMSQQYLYKILCILFVYTQIFTKLNNILPSFNKEDFKKELNLHPL